MQTFSRLDVHLLRIAEPVSGPVPAPNLVSTATQGFDGERSLRCNYRRKPVPTIAPDTIRAIAATDTNVSCASPKAAMANVENIGAR